MHPLFGNQRYYALHQYYKKTFGTRVMKAVIDGGFTCPNKDGTLSTGGCLFCDGGSGYFTGSGSVAEQLLAERKRIQEKHPDSKLIAYFQANTNTYAPLSVLREKYEEALSQPDVIGISIGTRADCISDEILAYLAKLSERTWITVELGLQTIHEDTAERMNLCCKRSTIEACVKALKARGIRVCLHIINGLPFETENQMLETVRTAGAWQPDAVKIQMLHVIAGTALARMHQETSFPILSMEEYARLVVQQLEYLPPQTVCERLTGDGDGAKLITPDWTRRKLLVLNRISQLQKELHSFQGKQYSC
ncbi:MAG: TIGR01212 family radical SAM protein [Ruminococcus sp.]|nr:TIGR01212 family radical SAM protein [Ruminococcus sp.]